jgi:hypothetical protein
MADNIAVSPPPKPIRPNSRFKSLEEAHSFLEKDATVYFAEMYKHMYFIWERTGGLYSNIPTSSVLHSSMQIVENNGNTETDLLQYNLRADFLRFSNSFVEIDAYGQFASNNNYKQVNVYFGNSLIFSSNPVAINSGSWSCQIKIVRVSSNSQKVISCMLSDNGTLFNKFNLISSSNDLTKDNLIRFTAVGLESGDVNQVGMYVKIFHV